MSSSARAVGCDRDRPRSGTAARSPDPCPERRRHRSRSPRPARRCRCRGSPHRRRSAAPVAVVISAATSGLWIASRMLPSPRIARYSGSARPAWRMNQTGRCACGSPRQAARNAAHAAAFNISTAGARRDIVRDVHAPNAALARPPSTIRDGSIALIPMTPACRPTSARSTGPSVPEPNKPSSRRSVLAMEAACRRAHVEQQRIGAGRHRRHDDDEVEADAGDEVGVRRGVRATVDVALAVDHDRSEEARDRRRRLDGGADVGLRRTRRGRTRLVRRRSAGARRSTAARPASECDGAGACGHPSRSWARGLRAPARPARLPGRNRHGAMRSRASSIGASGSGIRAGDLRLHARRLQALHPLQERRALG